MRSHCYAFLYIIGKFFLVKIDGRGKNYIGQNDALQLKQVSISNEVDIPFFVGSLHYEWCLSAETQQVHLFTKTLRGNHSDCFVVDVGMNDGFYTNMAGVLGCVVYSFELQSRCIDLSRLAIEKNGIKDKVTIFHNPVSSNHGEDITIAFPEENICDGGFTFSGPSYSRDERTHAHLPLVRNLEFKTIALDSLIPKSVQIDLLKIDVEGHELNVLRGAIGLFERGQVKKAVVEIGPIEIYDGDLLLETFKTIFSFGYSASTFNCAKNRGDDDTFGSYNIESFKTYLHWGFNNRFRCSDLRIEK
eukprot:gene33562-44944_t